MRKIFKNIISWSCIGTFFVFVNSTLLSCSSDKKEEKKEEKSDFIGFVDDQMRYQDKNGVYTQVPIIKKSDKLYRTAYPLDYFNLSQKFQLFDFDIEVSAGDISKRAKYYLDNTITHHGISLLGASEGAYISAQPTILVIDVSVRTETIYINFECDPEVLFIIDLNLWNSLETDPQFIYYKTGPDDPKYLIPTGTTFTTCFLCSRKKLTYDFEDSTDIICRGGIYQQINLEFEVITDDMTKYRINHMFDGSLVFNYYVKKHVDTFGQFYSIHFDYTFLANITPSEDEVSSKFTNVAYLLGYKNDGKNKELAAACAFCICWI